MLMHNVLLGVRDVLLSSLLCVYRARVITLDSLTRTGHWSAPGSPGQQGL